MQILITTTFINTKKTCFVPPYYIYVKNCIPKKEEKLQFFSSIQTEYCCHYVNKNKVKKWLLKRNNRHKIFVQGTKSKSPEKTPKDNTN